MNMITTIVLSFISKSIVLYMKDLLYNTLKEQLDSLHKIVHSDVRVVC